MTREHKNEYAREWGKNNRDKVRGYEKSRRLKTKKYIEDLKATTPCADCDSFFPHYIMQFDHLPGTEKKANVSALTGHSTKVVMEEIEKCEIVCANCHCTRTYNRR